MRMKIKQVVFLFILKIWFIALFLLVIRRDFFTLAQEPIPAANKSEILRYREQQDIFSNDLQGLGYSESAQIINEETPSKRNIAYYYKRGKDYFDDGQYAKALVEFKNALDWNPQYKPALKYVELIEEKIRQQQQLKERQDLAESKIKEVAQRRQEMENALLEQKKKLKYEQNIKQEQAHSRSLKKINEVKAKGPLNARVKQYELDKKIQEKLARKQEKINVENARLENLARVKAEKEQSEQFRREKLVKEKNIQRRNLEEKKRIAQQQKEKELAARIAAEEILLSKKEKAKHEQIIKLEQEKSKNLKKLNEARFSDELKKKLKKENLIKHSSVELTQAVAAAPDSSSKSGQQAFSDETKKPGVAKQPVETASLPDSSGVRYKEYMTDIFVPDNLELAKIQQEFENKYIEALREKERIKKDYNNLLLQVKELLVYRERLKNLNDLLENVMLDKDLFEKEKETVKLENVEFKKRIESLQAAQDKIVKDAARYKGAYERLYSEAVAKELKIKAFVKDSPVLEKKIKDMEFELKQLLDENKRIKKDYETALTKLNVSMVDSRRLKESEDVLVKSKANENSLMKEKNALKGERSRVLSQLKGLLEDRRRVKKLESLLEGNKAQIKAMQKENDTICKDYNSLLVQVKASIVDKKRLKDVQEALEKNKTDMNLLVKDSEAVKAQDAKLKDKIKQFEEEQIKLVKERDTYKIADSAAKELKSGISDLEKEKSDIFSKLKQTKNDNKNVKKENLELRAKIEEFEFQAKAAHKQETSDTIMKELKQMQKENELIKKDYASLLAQMKDLLADSRKVKEMGALLEKDKVNIALLEKEKEAAKTENIALKDKAKKLEELEKKLIKGTQDKGYDSESNLKRLKIKEIRPEDINLAKEDRRAALNQTEVKDAQLKELQSKFEVKKKQLSRQAEEYKKKYLKELERNDLAMQNASNLPQKFSDVVKKNEFLTRESAGMHYNLGVFFIKNKEYDRAIVEFEKAIELCPDDPYSYYNLGYIYAQYLIDRGKAVKYFRQYLQFVKNDDKDAEWVKDYLLTWEAYK